jgi:hypothetical protein
MDHIVCIDPDAKELDKLLLGTRTMIVRRAKEVPFGTVNPGDTLYFIYSGGCLIRARTTVKDLLYSDQLTAKTSASLLQAYQDQMQLTRREMERLVRKQYLVLIAVENTTPIRPFAVDRSNYEGQGDWLPVGDIRKVMTLRWSPWLRGKRVYKDVDLISDK